MNHSTNTEYRRKSRSRLPSRSRSPALPIRSRSASMGRMKSKKKRFDPTAFVKERKQKIAIANKRRNRSQSPGLRNRISRSVSPALSRTRGRSPMSDFSRRSSARSTRERKYRGRSPFS
eukprot:UN29941